jgi:hypothetical protein
MPQWLFPNNSTSTQPSAPQITAQRALTMISNSACRFVRSMRGSSKLPKWSLIEALGLSVMVILLLPEGFLFVTYRS